MLVHWCLRLRRSEYCVLARRGCVAFVFPRQRPLWCIGWRHCVRRSFMHMHVFFVRMTHASCVCKGGHGCRGGRCTRACTNGPTFEMDGIRCACSMRECHCLSLASASVVCRCMVLCAKGPLCICVGSSYTRPVLPFIPKGAYGCHGEPCARS